MPNGGSDCCGTCWFNAKNKGEAGYDHSRDPEPAYCVIRILAISNPFWTYCGNHPHRRPEKELIPIGPVYIGDPLSGRHIWQQSPDTEGIRQHLLDLLSRIEEQPIWEYPFGTDRDELVVWQLGEFREMRALDQLRRVAAFRLEAKVPDPVGRTREVLVAAAKAAIQKIEGSES